MYLVEEFLSVQGEGKYLGELSIFIRFGRCNRTCEDLKVAYKNSKGELCYGCDTYNAVDEDFINQWKEVVADDLIAIVKKYKCNNIVITGGEPLINIDNKDFINFLSFLNINNYKVTIETNGDTSIKEDIFSLIENFVFSISPKAKIKDKAYWHLNKNSYIKAIFGHEKLDTLYLKDLQSKGMNIYIMPKGEDSIQIEEARKQVCEYCIKNNFNYTTREHLFIFGSKAHNESSLVRSMSNIEHDKHIGRF